MFLFFKRNCRWLSQSCPEVGLTRVHVHFYALNSKVHVPSLHSAYYMKNTEKENTQDKKERSFIILTTLPLMLWYSVKSEGWRTTLTHLATCCHHEGFSCFANFPWLNVIGTRQFSLSLSLTWHQLSSDTLETISSAVHDCSQTGWQQDRLSTDWRVEKHSALHHTVWFSDVVSLIPSETVCPTSIAGTKNSCFVVYTCVSSFHDWLSRGNRTRCAYRFSN